ncbi:hypothetical protein [Roseivirga seohaensis]|uniref:hypothetical protein n=1 Tax=Roseivirga seohaensis TaxID=1914963 RepID=UPI003BA9068A
MKTHFAILLIIIAFARVNGQTRDYKNLLVGTWVDGISYDTDSAGNIVERISLNIGEAQPPPRQFDSIPTNLVFNSQGESFAFYNDKHEELSFVPFYYQVVGDTLKLGSRNYLFFSINKEELILRELNKFQLRGDFTFQKFTRENSVDFHSDSEEYSNSVKGDWITEYILQIDYAKEKWNDIPGVLVTDTLSKPITEPVIKFDFQDGYMRMFSDNKSIPSDEFRYDIIANYILDEDGNGLFTILKVNEDELTLLGPHALEMEGMPMMLWELKRAKNQ